MLTHAIKNDDPQVLELLLKHREKLAITSHFVHTTIKEGHLSISTDVLLKLAELKEDYFFEIAIKNVGQLDKEKIREFIEKNKRQFFNYFCKKLESLL